MDENFLSLSKLDMEIKHLVQRAIHSFTEMKLKMEEKTSIHSQIAECFHMIGSSIDGTMTARFFEPGKPDTFESDIMIETLVLPPDISDRVLVPVETRPGFYRIRKDEQFNECLSSVFANRQDGLEEVNTTSPGTFFSGMAIKFKAQEVLKFRDSEDYTRLILVGLFGGRVQDYSYNFNTKYNGPAVTMDMEIQLPNHNAILLSLDICCAIKLCKWPHMADEWINRPRKWPNELVMQEIAREPVYVVPKPSVEDPERYDEWRLTFVLAEKRLIKEWNDGMLLTYYIFKILYYAHLKEEICGECLPSYLAKTTMLWACEEREPEVWTKEHLQDNLQYLLRAFKQYMEAGHVPYFFRPDMNLIRHTNRQLITHILDTKLDPLITEPLDNLPQNSEDVLKTLISEKEILSKLNFLFEIFSMAKK